MKGLFNTSDKSLQKNLPLAARMRPQSLDDFVGQEHILGEGKILRKIIESDIIPSLIFYGPPGCGKTALAMVIARRTENQFRHLNAVTATVADVREVITVAEQRGRENEKRTILFLDEIAHFNKLQQDALMKDVEEGIIILIGATTHNPYFYLNTPLLSRSMVFQFNPLTEAEIKQVVKNALKDRERGLGTLSIVLEEDALDYLAAVSEGDARRALNTIETAVLITASGEKREKTDISLAVVKEVVQNKFVAYDRNEDQHYDTISAFIKSMRGSDPDASLYYLAKMVVAGEDPRFIARRMLIFASEDVGNADPQGLLIAGACYQAVEVVGMPEAKIILAQAVIYLATAPKSNSAYKGIDNAISEIKKEKIQPVPEHLRKTGYKRPEDKGYLYPHDFPGHYVPQVYMPVKKRFYFPSDSGYEKKIEFFLNHLKRLEKEYEEQSKKRVSDKERDAQ
jgi:putative ATPase